MSDKATQGQCARCGEINPKTAVLCKSCNSRLPWSAQTAAPKSKPPKSSAPRYSATPSPQSPTSSPAPTSADGVKFLPPKRGASANSSSSEASQFWREYGWKIVSLSTLLVIVVGSVWAFSQYGGLIRYRILGQPDLQYTLQTRSAFGGDISVARVEETQFYLTKGKRRIETTREIGGYRFTQAEITLCRKQQEITLDPDLGIYISKPIDASSTSSGGDETSAFGLTPKPCCGLTSRRMQITPGVAQQRKSSTASRKGKVIASYELEELGKETIAGVETIHYRLTTQRASFGCVGNSREHKVTEIWVAPSIYSKFECPPPPKKPESTPTPPPQTPPPPVPVPAPYVLPEPPKNAAPQIAASEPPSCEIEYEQHGNTVMFANAFRGLVMKMKLYEEGELLLEQEITQLKQGNISPEVFKIGDYRAVSDQEFHKERFKAMMKQAIAPAQPH